MAEPSFTPGRHFRMPPLWLIGVVVLSTILCTGAFAAAWGERDRGRPPAAAQSGSPAASASPSPSPTPSLTPSRAPVSATVTVDRNGVAGVLPANALGLSYEADQLVLSPGFAPDQGNLKNLMRTLGVGNLKIGANALDSYTFWNPAGDAVPGWAKAPIGHAEIDRVALLSSATGWPVELGANLARLDVARIADEAQYVKARLGSNLLAMECGNEPNGYPGYSRPADWGYAQYLADWDACTNAMAGAGVPIAGPNTYNNVWIGDFARDRHSRVVFLTDQPYSLSQHNNTGHTITGLLAPENLRNDVTAMAPALAAARQYGLPLRHDETNSVNLGGLAGVSDVYGTSLWAVDYTLSQLQAGVSGLNFHSTLGVCDRKEQDGRPRIYTAMCALTDADRQAGRLAPRPLYYGMLMVALMGTGTFLPATVSTQHNLTAYAVKGSDGKTRVMLVNKEPTTAAAATVALNTGQPAGTKASVIRLAGSALDSPEDITLAGATVKPDGTFTQGPAELATTTGAGLTLTLPGGSAALITL
ncbi:hypothetical protein GCM10020218_009010 [Dactylosporangium vinaceum]